MAQADDSRSQLPREARTRLEQTVDRFEQAWQTGRRPAVEDFVSEAEVERLQLLAELLHVDLEARWKAGEEPQVETYLARYPELLRDRDGVFDLIMAEYRARQRRSPGPVLSEFLLRFPDYAEDLRLWLRPSEGTDTSTPRPRDEPTQTGPFLQPAETAVVPRRPSVPGYEVLTCLGRGGMGVVYKARHLRLKRVVALKMIPEGVLPGAEELARFRREAEAVARFQHPNIVQVFDVGEHDGRPYLALEYVDGGSLAQKLTSPLPPRQTAQMIETVARAMHYAHQRGIVHRDLKPANVLLTADGIPKVTDFGLAKQMDGDTTRTRTDAILGTPRYMAPEQADSRRRTVGPATDVYALGVILYELLTGQPPFQGDSMLDTLEKVRTQEPIPPTQLQPKLPRALETICLTCLRKEPERRYRSAEALADDLQAYLEGEPIRARPADRWDRLVAWARRHPAAAVAMGTAGMAFLALLAGLWWHNFLAASAVAVLGLLVAGWWYNARLQAALREVARQQAETERFVERLHLMLEMTRRLMSAPDFASLLRLIGETTIRLANAERATIYLVDRERGEVWSKVTLGDDVGEIRVPLGVGLAGTVAATGTVINIPDAYADPRFNAEVDRRTGYRTRNVLTLPISAEDARVVGVFQILNKRTGAFTDDDVETLTALAASAAVAIAYAQRRGQGSSAAPAG